MPIARSRIVTGILRLRSTLTERTSRFDVSNSSQAPRFGISLAVETQLAGRRIGRAVEVDARRAHELRDDDALGAVDDERAVGRHHREVAEEDFRIFVLTGPISLISPVSFTTRSFALMRSGEA